GRPVNSRHIEAITSKTELRVEVGGGIRDEEAIRETLELGVQRVIIGTQAVNDFGWFSRMAETFRDRLVLGLDARGSTVATHGWQEVSQWTLVEFAKEAAVLPLAAIIYTDIETDGMLQGPNVAAMEEMANSVDLPVVASGGITTVDDVARLAALPLAGCIVGRALYERTLKLADALAVASP
ncbi:MAG: 1-(5-phosphoribosyl)-5-[(5-phosphoribosylamino)methylideneamino] imidazole-4-carboxamide isomerase, partial [Planctomycetes bacterium]|nr:1-(5-phosphoribosyl)-5-[(5-phosphoribosylamino)methylideneamino] imidazole-4-carboxamide isomerase [Planctomycetota bacterium]